MNGVELFAESLSMRVGLLAFDTTLWDWSMDGWIIVAGILCSLSGALLGCFLVLRKMSLLGDAISHSVLPGIVAAYWWSGSAATLPLWIGAICVGLLTVWLTESTRRYGSVDESASTGIVFTGLFAIGLVMVVRLANNVDLDLSCVLYGDIENVPLDMVRLLGFDIPRAVLVSALVLGLNAFVVSRLWKEFQITSFDPQLGTSLGFRSEWMHYLLASLVAITSVSSFESVGNILIVAMFVVPPSTAFLLTKRLSRMVLLSCIIAIASAILGHFAAIHVPRWFGFGSTSTAAMMTIVAGLFLVLAIFFSPQEGLLFKIYERWWIGTKILSEDILATLFRFHEQQKEVQEWNELRALLLASPFRFRLAIGRLKQLHWIHVVDNKLSLTELGRVQGQNLVRSHRLWEQYLSTEVGVETERLHTQAERLEHFTSRRLREILESQVKQADLDPHGSPIPPEVDSESSQRT